MSEPRAPGPRHRSPLAFVVAPWVIATLGLPVPGDLPAQQELVASGGDETASDARLIGRLLSDDELLLETKAGYPVASTLPEAASQSGTAVILIETRPDAAAGRFSFTGTPACSNTEIVYCLREDATLVAANLEPGTYTSTQVDPAPEFDVTDVWCDDGDSPTPSSGDAASRSAIFNIDPGETVTCTFVNTRRGTAVLAVETEPEGSSGSFAFTGTPSCDYIDADGETFAPGTEGREAVDTVRCVAAGGTLVTADLEPGTYTSTQIDPAPQFDVTDARCDDGDSPTPSDADPGTRTANFNIDPGETVTCTFVNTRRATVVVGVPTEPDTAVRTFAFNGPSERTHYVGANGTLVTSNLPPGTYSWTQVDPSPDFDVTDVRCDDGDSPTPSDGNPNTRTAVFNLDPGEVVRCMFVNTHRRAAAPYGDATLLAYFPYDGVPPLETARGLEAEQILFGGEDVTLVEGRYDGGVLYRSGSLTLLPLDIDPLTHPRITVTAWVLLDEDWDDSGTGALLGVDYSGSAAPQLRLTTKRTLEATAGAGRAVYHAAPLPLGEWTHVAAVWDYRARTLRLHVGQADSLWRDRVADPGVVAANDRGQPSRPHPNDEDRPERRYVLLGARTVEGSHGGLGHVALDDLRIYAGALSREEINAIRTSAGPAPLGKRAPPVVEEEDGNPGDLVGWTLGEDYELSDVSGSWGDRPSQLADLGTAANWTVVITEQRDVPCRLWILTVGRENEDHAGSDDCGGDPYDVPALPDGYVVTGLQVCQNRRNERVKGIRIAGRRIELDAEANEVVFREQDDSSNWLPNCGRNEWVEAVSCGGGQAASGLRVHFDRAGSREAIVGLELVCRDVIGVRR